MFGKRKKHKTARIETWVGKNTRLRGDIHFSGGLHVDGCVEGNVVAGDGDSSVLEVSENGSIEGQVTVPTVILNGHVTGDVHAAERIELAANCRVQGDVYYHMIEMAMGAEVNGKLVHVTGERLADEPTLPTPLQAVEQ